MMATELAPKLGLTTRMRGLAILRDDRDLLLWADDLEQALTDFFCDPPRMTAERFAATMSAASIAWTVRGGDDPGQLLNAEGWERLRLLALEVRDGDVASSNCA